MGMRWLMESAHSTLHFPSPDGNKLRHGPNHGEIAPEWPRMTFNAVKPPRCHDDA